MIFSAIYLFAINLITFILYGYDKHAAIDQKWRIPNRVLIGLAAFGGTIGALVGMYTFRHKTKTKIYTVTVPLFLIIQIVAVILMLSACGTDLAASAGSINTTEMSDDLNTQEYQQNSSEALYYDSTDFFEDIPEWSGYAFCYVNENVPDFEEDEIWSSTQESLEPLDNLGRCGSANSCIGEDGMPDGGRGNISEVIPTGWHTERYDFVEGEALYNRCHLIAHQLSGDDAIPRNLITGTSYMNRDGMLQFENAIGNYVRETGNHVMYRVTPIFVEDELVARGVHMEAISVEDEGEGLAFNVFCYNVQPGIDIDYETGDNQLSEDDDMLEAYQTGRFAATANTVGEISSLEEIAETEENSDSNAHVTTYILNTNTHKFHYPDCKSVKQMKDKNKRKVESTREEIISKGYDPCGNCKP